jgi:CRISPR-associated protein Cmr6
MPTHPERHIPQLFRSQIPGRCQLQFIKDDGQHDAVKWVDEWTKEAYSLADEQEREITDTRSHAYQISWRFVTNGGQDDSTIRPVLGKFGIPFYPGSSMKGAFRRGCNLAQKQRYCGQMLPDGDCTPGILRFHGGYPVNDDWQKNLIDIVHLQQDLQVTTHRRSSGAFCQISLYQPELQFTISSIEPLEDAEWETIWQIWASALDRGIGCRVGAGYGKITTQIDTPFYQASIKGEGAAPKLLDRGAEFRPNMFKAGIRGHALRIFGGLTDAANAERAVNELFGGIPRSGAEVGLLGMNFVNRFPPRIDNFGPGQWNVPTYEVEGELRWNLTATLTENERKQLLKLIRGLTRFAMIFGGFGKSWRRADHRIFMPDYNEEGTRNKPLIGCQWEWATRSLTNNYAVRQVGNIRTFINNLRTTALTWLELRGIPTSQTPANWVEAWHPDRTQVWVREALDDGDSLAIEWFHRDYHQGSSIARSDLTGRMGQVGRIWHRLYPIVELHPSPKDPTKKIATRPQDGRFIEILTIFPDRQIAQCQPFIEYLTEQSQYEGTFEKVWGN